VQNNSWLKKIRLRHSGEFQAVWTNGRSWTHALFVLWALPNVYAHTRIGIVASRKVGNAVARNRARRLLREAARQLYSNITSGWDIVLVARSGLLNVKESTVEDALRKNLYRAHIYQDSRIQ